MKAFALFTLVLCSVIAKAQRVYELKDAAVSNQIFESLSYQVDSSQLSLEKVITRPFVPLSTLDSIAKGNLSYWIKAEIRNETSYSQFVMTTDQWTTALVYVKEGEVWRQMASGTTVPVNQRPLSLHRLLSFPVLLKKNETTTIYIRAKYSQPLLSYFVKLYSFPSKIEIDEASNAYRKYISIQLMVMFIIGVLTILFFYHLNLFVLNKEKISLLLSVYLFASALAIANSNGIATNYFFTSITSFELVLGLELGHIIPLIMITFLIVFLKLTSKDWEFLLLIAFGLVVVVSMLVSLFAHVQTLYLIRRYLVYLSFLLVLGASIVKKRPGAKTLAVALLFTITTSYFAEFRAVFFKNIPFTGPDRPYLIGVLVQMLILSSAATYRVRSLQQGVEEMKEQQRDLIQKQNEQLRIQVEEKTGQLRSALSSLEHKKNQLEEANRDLSEKSISIQELNKKLEGLVQMRTQALESAIRDLDKFLYRTSHDLRRPLMTILGLANLAKKEKSPAKIHEVIGLVTKTVDDIDRMLTKLIAISFCYGEQVQKEQVDLRVVAEESIASVARAYSLRENQIELKTLGQNGLVLSNAYLLKIILFSILENAAQYGGEKVKVQIDADHGEPSILIEDNGPGIDLLYQELVFEMFFRAHEKSTGNGLGLYLVKIGMEKLGGSVKLRSRPNVGTEVKLSFSRNLIASN